MNIGLMWQRDDNKTHTLSDSLKSAIKFYKEKYGKPESCYVNPANFAELSPFAEELKINIFPAKHISLNNLWIGIEGDFVPEEKIFVCD